MHTSPQFGRRLTLVQNRTEQVCGEDFGYSDSTTLHCQNFSDAAVGFAVVNLRCEILGGFNAGSVINTQISPGEATKYRVSGRVKVDATAIGNDCQFGIWSDTPVETHPVPPITGQIIPAAAGVYSPVPPNNGFAPSYRRYFWIQAQNNTNYDLKIEDIAGGNIIEFLNLAPNPTVFNFYPQILPTSHRLMIRPNAGLNQNFLITWTDKT